MQKLFLLVSILAALSQSAAFAHEEKQANENKKEEQNESTKKAEETKPETKKIYYTLVDKSVKPEESEFYVKSIYRTRKSKSDSSTAIKALIARSNNTRSGVMFTLPIEYGIGDQLTENLKITKIELGVSRHIEVYDPDKDLYYVLRLSYGKAKSRLIPLPKEEENS